MPVMSPHWIVSGLVHHIIFGVPVRDPKLHKWSVNCYCWSIFIHKLYSMLICLDWNGLLNAHLVAFGFVSWTQPWWLPRFMYSAVELNQQLQDRASLLLSAMLKLSLKSRTSNNNLLIVCVGWIPKWMENSAEMRWISASQPCGPKWICLEIRPKTIAIPIENWRIWDDLGLHHLKEIPISRCGRQLGSCRTYWISTTWRWSWRTAKVVRLVRPWTGKITTCFNLGMMPGENSELHKVWKDLNKNSWDCLNLIQTYSRISPIGCMKTY